LSNQFDSSVFDLSLFIFIFVKIRRREERRGEERREYKSPHLFAHAECNELPLQFEYRNLNTGCIFQAHLIIYNYCEVLTCCEKSLFLQLE